MEVGIPLEGGRLTAEGGGERVGVDDPVAGRGVHHEGTCRWGELVGHRDELEGVANRLRDHLGHLAEGERSTVGDIVDAGPGRTGVDRALLGSVAEKVVRLSPVPVLTVKSRQKQ